MERLLAISNGDTPASLPPKPKLVIHCLPLASFVGAANYEVKLLDFLIDRIPVLYSSGSSQRINFDGIVASSGQQEATAYTQVFRSGAIEAVHTRLLGREYNGVRSIPSVAYEEALMDFIPKCFCALQQIDCPPPVFIALTLIGAKGLYMGCRDVFARGEPITADTLVIPETEVADYSVPVERFLKPLLDVIWNACGYSESLNFDESGHWAPQR